MLEGLSADWIGSAGVAMLLLAFGLNVFGRIERRGLMYCGLNAMGALIAAYASWMINFVPFVVLEGTWCVVSLVAFTNVMTGRATRNS